MKLDTFTILAALTVICFGLSIAILVVWRFLSDKKQLLIWGMGIGFYGAGVLLIILREHIPLIFSATLGNVLLMGCYGMIWWGMSVHRGKKPHLTIIVTLVALGTTLHAWFTFADPDLAIRIIILRIFIFTMLAATIKNLLDKNGNAITSMEKVMTASLVMDAAFRFAIMAAQFSFFNYQAPIQKNLIATIGALFTIVSMIAWGMAIILVALEKIVAERATAEAESGIMKKHLETTFYAMTDMVCLLDLHGKIIIHNRAMERFLGLSGDDINGRYCYELMHATDKRIESCPFERMLNSKQRESMLLETNGHWLEVSVDPVLDADRQIIAAVHLIKDVTEHKNLVSELEKARDKLERTVAERTLQLSKSNQLLEEASSLARVGGWEIDLETGLNTWSKMTYEIHEVEPGFIPTTEAALKFYAPEAVPKISEAVQHLMKDGQPFDLELPLITAKGNHIWVRSIGQPQYEEDRVVKIRGVFQEITEHKQLEIIRESELNYRSYL